MTQELDAKGLELAHEAYAKTAGGMIDGNSMANAITAYLRAVRAKTDLGRLAAWLREQAQDAQMDDLHRTAEKLAQAADALSASEARIAELEGEMWRLGSITDGYGKLDAELAIAERNRDASRSNFLTMPNSANKLRIRADTAESRIAELTKALEPFARAGDIFEVRSAGRPINDDDPVYDWEDHRVGARRITVGNFRAARKTLEDGK